MTASLALDPPVPLDADRLRAMLDALAAGDPDLRRALACVGYPAPRQRDPGFATLLRIILAQQVSTASAAAIWRKLRHPAEPAYLYRIPSEDAGSPD